MKKIRFLIIILIMSLSIPLININTVSAKDFNYKEIRLRAGGGSSSSSGGSGGGSNSSHHRSSRNSSSSGSSCLISDVFFYIFFIIITFKASIILYTKVIRASVNSKRYMKILKEKDISWNYKEIENQVINAFYTIEESWTSNNLELAKEYLSDELYNQFQVKLNWMEYSKRKNILKKIKLRNLKPISVIDDEDDSKDLIWFYIKGKMIDYTINTETNEKIEGNNYSTSFVEFWKFIRTKENTWVLDKILQENEIDKIKLQ